MDPLARRGFGASLEAARVYERGRPGYAAEVAPWLVGELGLSRGSRVLDLAAGTGQLSRLFLPLVGSVVAVEPSAPMRSVLAAQVGGVEVLDGVAERLPLADATIDAALVGNAFHWFDGPVALRELARVLRPGGGLAILWNSGLGTEPPTPELDAFVAGLRAEAGVGRRRADEAATWRRAFAATGAFAPLQLRVLDHTRAQDRETFVAYLASLAFVAASPERSAVVERMRELAPEVSILSLRTECYWTRRRLAA